LINVSEPSIYRIEAVATPPDFYSSLRTQPEAEAGMPVAELIRRMGITEQTF
jgi:hypothetical protein